MRFTFNSFSPAAGRTEHDLLPTRTCVAHGCYGRVRWTAAQLTFVFTVFAGLLVHRRRRRPCAGARPLHVRCARARASGGGRPSAVCRSTRGPARASPRPRRSTLPRRRGRDVCLSRPRRGALVSGVFRMSPAEWGGAR